MFNILRSLVVGANDEDLRNAPASEQAEATMRVLAFGGAYLLHITLMTFGLAGFGVSPMFGVPFGMLTGLLSFVVDRNIVSDTRAREGAGAFADEVGKEPPPARNLLFAIRMFAACVVMLAVGQGAGLSFFGESIEERRIEMQEAADRPIILQAKAQHDLVVASAQRSLQDARDNLERFETKKNDAATNGLRALEDFRAEQDRLRSDIKALAQRQKQGNTEAGALEDKLVCEEKGVKLCPGASGRPGKGPLYLLTAQQLERLKAELKTIEAQLVKQTDRLENLVQPTLATEDDETEKELRAAIKLAEVAFAGAVSSEADFIASELAEHPERQTVGSGGLFSKLKIMGILESESVSFLIGVLLIHISAVALELTALIGCAAGRAGLIEIWMEARRQEALDQVASEHLEREVQKETRRRETIVRRNVNNNWANARVTPTPGQNPAAE